MTRRGFTILELMVVLAMIGILASMLFPVFARSREQARAVQCAANMAELGLALQMYAADWSGHYPPREDDLGPIAERVQTEAIFRCPSARAGGLTSEQQAVLAKAKHVTYFPQTAGGPKPKQNQYGDYPVLADGHLLGSSYYYHAGLTTESAPRAVLVSERELSHMGKAHVLYASGAVKRVTEGEWLALVPASERYTEAQIQGLSGTPPGGGMGTGGGRGGHP